MPRKRAIDEPSTRFEQKLGCRQRPYRGPIALAAPFAARAGTGPCRGEWRMAKCILKPAETLSE
jgi:hypothetical protein